MKKDKSKTMSTGMTPLELKQWHEAVAEGYRELANYFDRLAKTFNNPIAIELGEQKASHWRKLADEHLTEGERAGLSTDKMQK